MSLVIDHEALAPDDLPSADGLAAHAGKTRSKGILLVGVLLGLIGLAIVALRAPGSACAVGVVALALVAVAAWLIVSVMGDVVVLKMLKQEGASLDAVRRGGVVEVLRLSPDAAWRVQALDEESPALLLRCGNRFLYLNEPLDQLVEATVAESDSQRSGDLDGDPEVDAATSAESAEPKAEPKAESKAESKAEPRASRIRVRRIVEVRRLPAPDGRVLDVLCGEGWLPLAELPSISREDPALKKIADLPEWSSAVLAIDQLPEAWSAALDPRQRRAAPA